ncbi:unnamed protein product [Allacma fusca]|uniref:Ionotropic receptor n=1 Tax=Allacma fusca TaxID=39272 RepID=A0A8J2LAH2_9HEXA|nr:unnamed protein product [Allacma fusca]
MGIYSRQSPPTLLALCPSVHNWWCPIHNITKMVCPELRISHILRPFQLFHSITIAMWFQDDECLRNLKLDQVVSTTALIFKEDQLVTMQTSSVNILISANISSLMIIVSQITALVSNYINNTSDAESGNKDFINTNVAEKLWYFICFQSLSDDEIINSLRTIPWGKQGLKLNSQFFILIPNNNYSLTNWWHQEFRLWEFFQIKSSFVIQQSFVRNWQDLLINSISLPSGRRDFQQEGVDALGVCIESYANECTASNSSGTLIFESGLSVALFSDLKDSLNFRYTAAVTESFVIPESIFEEDANPAWLLGSKQIDVFISHEIYRPGLVAVFDIVQPTYLAGIMAYFTQPHVHPVSVFVDVCYLDKRHQPFSTGLSMKVVSDAFTWTLGAVVQRRRKLTFLTVVFASLLWNSAYQGGYVSTLSVRFQPIQSFQQLLTNYYKLILNSRSASIDNYSKGLFHSYEISMENVKKMAREHVLEWITETRSAYLEYEDSFYGILDEVLHPKNIDPDDFFCNSISKVFIDRMSIPSGFVLQKNSPFREVFNLKILHLKERGLNARYLNIYKGSIIPKCLPNQNRRTASLDLEEVSLGFHILIFGLIACLALLILERMFWYFLYR